MCLSCYAWKTSFEEELTMLTSCKCHSNLIVVSQVELSCSILITCNMKVLISGRGFSVSYCVCFMQTVTGILKQNDELFLGIKDLPHVSLLCM